ncbi:WXG100 family type VII secretion target [Streptomyces sp. NPDC007983]|uniref:WXG100 family type VII secretion target n=1 Tax=Streptomyces sp. NPDC007983 TaxID=3364800 RepID=UPI0036E47FDC
MEITYSRVVEAANQVKHTANTMKSELDTLMGQVKRVVATWDGETQRAFYDRQRDWETQVGNLHEHLLSISSKMTKATEGYQSNDKAQARRFQG